MKSFFKPHKITLGIFALLFAFSQFGPFFGGFLITWPIYPIVYAIQERFGINPSHIGTPVYDQFQYGIQLPINVAFEYLLSCWIVFIFKNIGGVHHRLAIIMALSLFLLYVLPVAIASITQS